jgi:hypothetical protein
VWGISGEASSEMNQGNLSIQASIRRLGEMSKRRAIGMCRGLTLCG